MNHIEPVNRDEWDEQRHMSPACTRLLRSILVSAGFLALVSCVKPLRDDGPAFDESRAKDIVAVIDVISVRDYERNSCFGYLIESEHGNDEVLCASSPPFRVHARVLSQLYGPPIGRSVFFKTASHWGSQFLDNGNLKLVHLQTDGVKLEMPNESQTDVGIDVDGAFFVPAYPDEISWLPCGTNAAKKPIVVKAPANKFGEEGDSARLSPEAAARVSEYYVIAGDKWYPRYGVPTDSLSKFLQERRPQGHDFDCR